MAEGTVTIAEALRYARARLAGGDSPRADAEILLAHVLGRPRSYLVAWPEQPLASDAWVAYQQLVARRAEGVPVAYLTGMRAFFGLELAVTDAVLIPRPETELLVEAALERLPHGPCALADLGTGSGAIALAIASVRPEARVVAVEASPRALAVARANAERLGLRNVELRQGDWCQGLGDERFDMIVSNPPYIRAGDPHLGQGDVRFEPAMALASGPEGLDAIRAILACAPAHLAPGGWLLFEHGYDQAEAVAGLMREAGFSGVQTLADLLGHGRVTLGRAPVGQPSFSVE
ncbi:peptide chain release factor N(5)-glutamine methyltransferase [Thiofaba sp. EF100]|uniref:peptide chain release factor N(5)-glutamine methyltransferase n=1 Tax=Thiofaba sp. EF100 TaxID=3121274 RepID=UPI003221C100